MKLRNLGLALTAVCATVAGVIGTANNAYAGTSEATVIHAGSVPASCSFSAISDGELILLNGYILGAGFLGVGTPAQARVVCGGTGSITVANPVQLSGPDLTGRLVGAWITDPNSNQVILAGSPSTRNLSGFTYLFGSEPPTSDTVTTGSRTYEVRMGVFDENSNPIGPGNYSYSTTLTATY